MAGLVYFLYSFLPFFTSVRCFNLDVDIPVYKTGEPDTYFGYAVAQHVLGSEPVILVGAPKAQSGQVGTDRAGALFSCPINTVARTNSSSSVIREEAQWCQRRNIEYPTEDGQNYYSKPPNTLIPEDVYTKNGQWLGSTVSSAGTTGSRVLVCAPNLISGKAAYIEGACFLLRNDLTNIKRFRSCKTFPKKNRHNDYSVCQEGFSAMLSEKYQMLVTGMPGARRWTGGVFGQDIDESTSTLHYRWTMDVRGENAVETDVKAHSYFGYSVGIGTFGFAFEITKPDGMYTLAVGCTRCNETGAVYFLPFNKKVTSFDYSSLRLLPGQFNLTGDDSFLSGFGYSLCVIDIEQNRFDDLLIGAPYYYETSEGATRGGAVFVYYSSGAKQAADASAKVFRAAKKLTGPIDSMFGASVASVGDLNQDGFLDFAVGAPFEKKGGAVYIFFGAPYDKFSLEPAQVIRATDLKNVPGMPPLETFGWSLSGGTDVDGNGYPDVVVGAFKSNTAVLLRAKPIIHVVASVEESDLVPIDLDRQQCTGYPEAKACFSVRTKLRVRRQAVGPQLDYASNIFQCRLEVLPDSTGVSRRAEFRSSTDKWVKNWLCGAKTDKTVQTETHNLFIKKSNRDWLNPLKFKFTVSLNSSKTEAQAAASSRDTLPDLSNFPVLDKSGSETEFTIEFDKKCGKDNKCVSDLNVQCSFINLVWESASSSFVKHVGKDDDLDLQYRIDNNGERAYESSLFVTYNDDELDRPELILEKGSPMVQMGKFENGMVEVMLGNPLEAGASLIFKLRFKLSRGRSVRITGPLVFASTANSTSTEKSDANNVCTVKARVFKRAELDIAGTSDPSLVYFGGEVKGESAMEYEEDVGPQVQLTYLVRNNGPWGVGNVTVLVEYPFEVNSPFAHGKWALYLMSTPTIEIPIPGSADMERRNCYIDHSNERVDPLNLRVSYPSFHVSEERFKREAGHRRAPDKRRLTVVKEEDQQGRQARALRIRPEEVQFSGETYSRVVISCNKNLNERTAKCFVIRCLIDYLEPNITASIRIRSRLWNSTFVEDYRDVDHVLIKSRATVEIDKKQGIEETNYTDNEAETVTRAQPDVPKIAEVKRVPIWIIVVSVAGGIFILFLIIVGFWKCGFFKRRRRSDEPLYTAEYKANEDFEEN